MTANPALPPLPIDDVLPQLIAQLGRCACVVLRAPTGAGKTTRVPPAILAAGLADKGKVLLLQPRRLAARAAAWRMATEAGSEVGQLVGYQVRFERNSSARTRILAVTEGIALRMLQDDPFLEDIGAVVLDEFHERSLDADLTLAMLRKLQREARPELKLVVMSATLAAAPLAAYLGDCPIVESQGRLFPVAIEYLPPHAQLPLPQAAARGVADVLARTAGDVLVFLPGVAEIRRTHYELTALADEHNLDVMQLYGDLPFAEQQAVLERSHRRKVILSTNVAETSLTIEGVTAVVDSGLARVNRIDPTLGLNRLQVERISRASAEQRAGRAGRTAPGVCLRLWTSAEQHALADHDEPEIRRVDLAGPLLELLCWGETDVRAFDWFEAPPPAAVSQALALLGRLDAINPRGVTDLGRQMGRLPIHPRLARLLVDGHQSGHTRRAALLAALISERDPFGRSRGLAQHQSDSDALDRLAALEDFQRSGQRHSAVGTLDSGAAKFILRAAQQLERTTDSELRRAGQSRAEADRSTKSDPKHFADADEALLHALAVAFGDRLARRRTPGGRRAVMLGGRGVRQADESAVTSAELMVCIDIQEIGQNEALARQVSLVRREWLATERLTTSVEQEYDAERERVVAVRRTRLEDLILDESPAAAVANEEATAILAREAARRLGDGWQLDAPGIGYLARVRSLARWMPELELPELGDDPLAALLPQLCQGRLSLADLRKAPLVPAVQSLLTSQQIAAIEREAPERIAVPSGSRLALVYEVGKSPVLEVRIQEVFGLRGTPRIAGGRVPVLLHLLAPNFRPQQVTSDLESFWKNTYPLVRKELKRRYPKHSWPDDPLTAVAENKGGRRS